jgi:pyruvate kinase
MSMNNLPSHKTKLVCTIGPASDSPEMLEKMIMAGLNVARLNFSHGDFDTHGKVIRKIRAASEKTGRRVAIMADLPGPKMRIGDFEKEPVLLEKGARFTLTARDLKGTAEIVSMTMKELPRAVSRGDILFLNDGLIQLQVDKVEGDDIHCTVVMGGELRSRKGLNIPGIKLGSSAFTPRDRECMEFALANGVDAVSQSFVSSAHDIEDVRKAAAEMGHDPFIIAKVERSKLIDEIDGIITASDGIMVARGDLGVEMPIEQIAIAQKFITRRANIQGKPVITATQMLESMTHNRRPTRAEATDVANAILDGTDAVMLSEESAMGDYPLEAVEMLARIAVAAEPYIHRGQFMQPVISGKNVKPVDIIASSIDSIIKKMDVAAVFCPTDSGATARSVTRFRLPCWVFAPSTSEKTCRQLMFSHGVWPVYRADKPVYWSDKVGKYLKNFGIQGDSVLVVEGPSKYHPDTDHRLELVDLTRRPEKEHHINLP